jgi:hypothetical protein
LIILAFAKITFTKVKPDAVEGYAPPPVARVGDFFSSFVLPF